MFSQSSDAASAKPARTDVAIIGAGFAGISAAAALSRQNYDVTLIDVHAAHPPDFRAEKLSESQMAFLTEVGLGEQARRVTTAFDGAWSYRFGRIVDKGHKREYGGDYANIVNAIREGLPVAVHQIVGRVETAETGTERQVITLKDGRSFEARLLIVATGLGDAIRKKIGVEKTVTSAAHSLSCGFDLAGHPSDYAFPSLVWNGDRSADRLSYLTLFPIGNTVRANLFVYRQHNEPWTQALHAAPRDTLRALFPGFESEFGSLEVKGPIVARPIDLSVVSGHLQPGVVLVGDAFSTVCPASGTGIDKATIDVSRLCLHYIPQWLATPGMGLEKIGAFYADPAKTARDESAMRASYAMRAMQTDPGMLWKARRLRDMLVSRYHSSAIEERRA